MTEESPSDLERDVRRERRYLEECATACLWCGAPLLRREIDRAEVRRIEDHRPRIEVPCCCVRCGGEWVEQYGLKAVLF